MKKVYVVVYVSVVSDGIYTEHKVSTDESLAREYFKNYVADVAETTGNNEILEYVNDSVLDYGGDYGTNMYHVEITETEVIEK